MRTSIDDIKQLTLVDISKYLKKPTYQLVLTVHVSRFFQQEKYPVRLYLGLRTPGAISARVC
jgi:hypothetical protein